MTKLKLLLDDMDLPVGKLNLTKENILWLLRNVTIRNKNHPKIDEAVQLLKSKLGEFNDFHK